VSEGYIFSTLSFGLYKVWFLSSIREPHVNNTTRKLALRIAGSRENLMGVEAVLTPSLDQTEGFIRVSVCTDILTSETIVFKL
jgi:hypothetical protein